LHNQRDEGISQSLKMVGPTLAIIQHATTQVDYVST
jgi:hypothetical protein